MSYQSIKLLPQNSSLDNEWISWYKDLRSTLGKTKANRIFGLQWDAQNGYDSDANTSLLREEMRGYGVEIGTNAVGSVVDYASDVKSYFGDLFTTGKWVTIAMAGILVVSVGGLLIQIAFKSKVRKEAVGIGTTIASRGLIKG